ncbi:LRR domain containing protein [Trema orientale]|uniref:LRR domain containing protein n=1 Tax=Trema orientale TaxID=63057 RepID=A0A2P5F7K8_TREOI|nr:LRR domain containing protein [Trema orientale]
MESLLLSPVLQVVLDKLATPVLEKFGNMWDLKENIQKLQRTLPMVQDLLEDAKDQRETNTAVRIWLSKLEYVAFDAEYLLADFTMSRSPSGLHNCSKVVKTLHTLEMTIDEGNFRDIECRKIYANFRYLQVLGLTGCGLQTLESIQNLSCLKYLDLSHTPIQVLPPGIRETPLITNFEPLQLLSS